jgi:hypothetical protein
MTDYFSHDAEHPDYIRMPGPAQELVHVLPLGLVAILVWALLTAHDQPPLSHEPDEPFRNFASGAPSPEFSAAVSSIGNNPVVCVLSASMHSLWLPALSPAWCL